MHEPITAADGQTYERTALAQWLLQSTASPWTNANIGHLPVYANRAVKQAIEEWILQYPDSEGDPLLRYVSKL